MGWQGEMVKIKHEIDYEKLMEYIAKETRWAMKDEKEDEKNVTDWLLTLYKSQRHESKKIRSGRPRW